MTTITKIALIDIDEHDNMLWVKKRGLDTWILPGGKLEPGESEIACLQRELVEELLTNVPGVLHYARSVQYPAVGHINTWLNLHMYYGRLNSRKIHPAHEIEYAAYFPIGQLHRSPIPDDFKQNVLPWIVELLEGRAVLPSSVKERIIHAQG